MSSWELKRNTYYRVSSVSNLARFSFFSLIFGTKYSRMDQSKFLKDSL